MVTQSFSSVVKTLIWLNEVKPDAVVFLSGESVGADLATFYFPQVGMQSLSKTPDVIALYHVKGQGWKSTDESKQVDEMLMLIERTGREVTISGLQENPSLEILDMVHKLDMLLAPSQYAWQ